MLVLVRVKGRLVLKVLVRLIVGAAGELMPRRSLKVLGRLVVAVAAVVAAGADTALRVVLILLGARRI